MVKPRYPLLFLLLVGGMMAAYHWSQPALPEQADYYAPVSYTHLTLPTKA